MFSKREIDHIVYAVPNLEEAMDWFEQAFGVRPMFGGHHTTQGTKNAVLHLGSACYLEILAIDTDNQQINPPRWMGVEKINSPRFTRWALKSTDLERDSFVLQKYNTEMGVIQGGQRKKSDGQLLAWEMILPLADPVVELLPFMTDWQNSEAHPTESMPEKCQLLDLEFTHPSPQKVTPIMDELLVDLDIIKGEEISIKAKIKTPKGIIQL